MKNSHKTPKKFSWKVTVEQNAVADKGPFQEQCSCGPGGGDQCAGQCGSK